ncbi:MAG: hypothetical protein WC378_14655 [Opitutaceae bacterium]|jgi:hypothetical protein
MKTNFLTIVGSLVLLACMIFALARLETADRWVPVWLPFVIAGVALTFIGAFTNKNRTNDS